MCESVQWHLITSLRCDVSDSLSISVQTHVRTDCFLLLLEIQESCEEHCVLFCQSLVHLRNRMHPSRSSSTSLLALTLHCINTLAFTVFCCWAVILIMYSHSGSGAFFSETSCESERYYCTRAVGMNKSVRGSLNNRVVAEVCKAKRICKFSTEFSEGWWVLDTNEHCHDILILICGEKAAEPQSVCILLYTQYLILRSALIQ